MSLSRQRQAEKVLDARQRAVDLAEAELAVLMRQTREAKDAADRARATLTARMAARPAPECSSDDMAQEHRYLLALAKEAELAISLSEEAKRREEGGRLKVCSAKTEQKKVENWRDRLIDARAIEEARLERLQGDELAARFARKA